MNRTRSGRQRLEMGKLQNEVLIYCPRCLKPFKRFTDLERHLTNAHNLDRITRVRVYKNMGIKLFQNYSPPGWWVE